MAREATPTAKQRLTIDDWVVCALDVLADEGVSGIKVSPLCTRLGVTKGSFYWHFADIEAFLAAVAEHWAAGRDADVASFVELETLEPAERLKQMMMRFSDPAAWPLERAVRDWSRTNAWVRDRVMRTDAVMAIKVKEAFEGIGFSESEALLRSQMLFCAGVGFMTVLPDGAEVDLALGAQMIEILAHAR